MGMPRTLVAILLSLTVLFASCKSGDIDCPTPAKVRLNKKTKANYRVLMARHREERERGLSIAELKELQEYNKKSMPMEEWDCPKPGMKKTPKTVAQNIRKNRKRMEQYYKKREQSDSISVVDLVKIKK